MSDDFKNSVIENKKLIDAEKKQRLKKIYLKKKKLI